MNMQMKHFASAALVLFAALAAHSSGAVKVACIGDSITYGLGLADRAKESYPAQLQKLLDEFEPGKYEVKNFGNSGRGIYLDSMRGSERRGFRYMPEHKAALAWKPDIVICNLGINDCGEYIKEYTGGRRRGQFIEDYLALLGDYSAQAKTNLAVGCRTSNVVCRVPKIFIWTKLSPLAEGQKFYRSPEPFLMQADLEAVAKKMNAVGLDMQEPLREKMDGIFARDKIHPNAEGARIIAEATFKAMIDKKKVGGDSLSTLNFKLSTPSEVWLCVGQSNMQKGWNEFNATPQEKERVKGEMARLAKCNIWFWDFNDGKWTKLSPDNAIRKSAFGVSFAIRRAEATGKAIAMIYVAAGGAPTESFLSEQTMCAMGKDGKPLYPHLAAIATNRHRLDQNKDFPCAWVAREYPRRRNNMEEGHWWPVSKMYDNGIKRIKESGMNVDGILWYQGESNATTCIAPDAPTDRDYQLETLRALVSELRSAAQPPSANSNLPSTNSQLPTSNIKLPSTNSQLPTSNFKLPTSNIKLPTPNSQLPTFIMMGLPKMNRPWEQYRAVQKQVCDETGAIFVDTFAAGLGEANDVHPRDKTAFADLAAKAVPK